MARRCCLLLEFDAHLFLLKESFVLLIPVEDGELFETLVNQHVGSIAVRFVDCVTIFSIGSIAASLYFEVDAH